MTAGELLIYCQEKGIKLCPKPDGTLTVYAPRAEWTPEIRAEVKAKKPEIFKILILMETFDCEVVAEC